VDLLLPSPSPMAFAGSSDADNESSDTASQSTRTRLLEQVASGSLDARQIELVQTHKPQASSMFAGLGLEQMDPDMASMFDRLIPEQSKRRRVTIEQARRILVEQETDKLLDREKIITQAIERTQNDGIIFIDEIDKIAMGSGKDHGPDVSRQGVQRDLLPIVEGSSVTTKHGVVNTDHILFIAAGAFHVAAVSDLMPELQGRFPIRVELSPLTREDFVRILTEPDNALTKQQHKLLAAEGLEVTFEPGSIDAIADLAAQANATLENIGARRLMTIVEKVFEQINFEAPDMVAQGKDEVVITESFVRSQVQPLMKDQKKSRFWL
jgi:ATP-dependent HslUV protease ATP-binding subunit HslU